MNAPSPTVIREAELLLDLVECLLAGQLWTLQQRKDARILSGSLIDHSRAADMAARMNAALDRKLTDDTNTPNDRPA